MHGACEPIAVHERLRAPSMTGNEVFLPKFAIARAAFVQSPPLSTAV
jgi:hypothetical protein